MRTKDNLLDPECVNFQLLISEEEIVRKLTIIGKKLDSDYQGRELTVVMIMKGAICLVADLIRQLHIPFSIEFIQASSFKGGTTAGELTVFGIDQLDLRDKDVLVVDDIFDSGATMAEVVRLIQNRQPHSVRSLVLLSKNAPRKTSYRPDYALFEIENRFVVGYGLDYKEQYRGLPGVYVLELTNT